MKQYLTGLITGILLTVSATMFLGARTVNVKKKNLGHIVVRPDLISIEDYSNNNDRELSFTNEKLVFKQNGYVHFTLPDSRLN